MARAVSIPGIYLLALALNATGLGAADALPSDPQKSRAICEEEHALGSWGGLRSSLEDRGVVFNLTYVADSFGVVSGGIKRGFFYNGLLDLGMDANLEKLVGLHGTHFHVNGLYPHGGDGSAHYVGDIGTFSNIGAYDTYRLYELWVEQEFFNGHLSLRAGQTTFDSEFAVLDSYGGLFGQSGYGAPEAFSANLPLPVYPNATPGVRMRIGRENGLYFQGAAFDGNVAPGLTPDRSPDARASNELNRHGTQWGLRREEGLLWANEIGFKINQIEEEAEPSATRTTTDGNPHRNEVPSKPRRGLAGSYKVGFLHHTDSFADIYDVTLSGLGSALAPSQPRNRGANCAIYANIEQEIWREPGTETQGLGAFGHAAWMPDNRNFVDFSFEGGLHYLGLIPGRDNDALGLGVAFIHISDKVRSATRDANRRDQTSNSLPDFESTLELVYRYQATRWSSIQPHAQYVIQPGGTENNENALILGLRINIAF